MINYIKMQNFKCFIDQIIPFSNLTLLSGLNGMGKSSVLQTLLLLRQSFQQGFLEQVGLSLNGELINIGTGRDALYDNALENIIGFEIACDGVIGKWTFDYNSETDVPKLTSKPIPKEIYQQNLFIDKFQYLEAERSGPRTSFETSYYQVNQHRWLGKKGEYAVHFLHTFESQPVAEKLRHAKADASNLLKQAEAWLGEISPGTRVDIQAYNNLDQVAMTYKFEGRLGNDYRPTNVGFGITYVLPILVALLASQPDDLILLENPEAHLHPRGQAKMGQLIGLVASLGTQVIVETHSDHLLNGIRLAVHGGQLKPEQVQLHFFDRDEHGNSIVISPKIDRNGRIDQWPDGFFDEWDKSLMTLLMPAKGS